MRCIATALALASLLPNAAHAFTDGPRYPSRELDCIGNGTCNQGTGAADGVCDVTGSGNTYLRFDLFGINLPADVTSINGITVEVKSATSLGCAAGAQLAILNPTGDVKQLLGPTSPDCSGSTYQTLGGPTDTWGLVLSRSDVMDANFGVVITTAGCPSVQVDAARITVHYSTPAPEGCGDSTIVAPETCDDGNTVRGDGCSASCDLEQALDADQQKCVNSMSKAGAKTAKAVGKAVDKCVKAFVTKGANFADCDAAYRADGLLAATDKIAASATKLCVPAPPFGFVDASTTSTNAVNPMDAVTTLVIGGGLPNSEQPDASCQAAVLTATRKLLATRNALFNQCKRDGLAGETSPQMISRSDLSTCVSALPDGAGAIAEAENAIVKAFQSRCGGILNLGDAIAAPCGGPYSYQDITACLANAVESNWCNSTAAANGLIGLVTCP